jgi:phospholipid/cholesterol/gamma-HCH transport system permease protein
MVFHFMETSGKMLFLFFETVYTMFSTPLKFKNLIKQMEFIGVKSIFVVMLTGLFAGMVLALQSYYAFKMFGAESLIGVTVALSMLRELGPVLGSLMVTARAGSAIAAELGTMRVTEQIDAMEVMGVNPVRYLIVPRVVAGMIVVPILVAIVDFIGVIGGFLIGVKVLGVNEGVFWNKIFQFVQNNDLRSGLIKAVFFGLILTFVACYTGYSASKGAEGVGKATTHSVVISSVMILMADYILTAFLF